MSDERMMFDGATRSKKKGHPVGKLGARVKEGIVISRSAFFDKYNKTSFMKRVGEGSIRP